MPSAGQRFRSLFLRAYGNNARSGHSIKQIIFRIMGLSIKNSFWDDLLASVVVFLVALPLCMGVAVASGVPPALGLITGIVGGLVVGSISGSPLQVSGPAAGLTVLIYEIVQQHGLKTLGVIVLLAGLLQIAGGLLKIGQWFRAISPAVIQGMLAGIGILIIGSQIHVAIDDSPRGSGLDNLLSIPEAIWKGLMPVDGSTYHIAAAVGTLTIGLMIAWSFAPKKFKIVPAPLLAVAVCTFLAAVLQLPIKKVSVSANILTTIELPSFALIADAFQWPILSAAVAVALIASAETLLSATAVDRLHNGPSTQYNRELFAQGVGNSICGLLGALPMTGVIVRSSANVEAGAKTRLSAVLHGLWILACVAALPFVLNRIPTASLAAILVFTGFKLVSPKAVRSLLHYGKSEVAIYVVTVVAIVATNLLEGVLIGLGLSIVKLVWKASHLETAVRGRTDSQVVTLSLKGSATFLGLPKLAAAFDAIPQSSRIDVDINELIHIDHACLDFLASQKNQRNQNGGQMTTDWDLLLQRYHRTPVGEAFLRSSKALHASFEVGH
jgi:MFS superfamily sulfate permease-like transporter